MPNNKINPDLAQTLGSAFGGGSKPPQPAPPAPAGFRAGPSMLDALFGRNQAAAAEKPAPASPYDKLVDPSKR